jgi:hypothetical protein
MVGGPSKESGWKCSMPASSRRSRRRRKCASTWRRQSAACGSIRQSSKFSRCSLLHFKSCVPGITRSRSRDTILRQLFQMRSMLLTSRTATSFTIYSDCLQICNQASILITKWRGKNEECC